MEIREERTHRPMSAERGVIVEFRSHPFPVGQGKVRLADGTTLDFELPQCKFTPFVGLPVIVERAHGEITLALAPEGQPLYRAQLEAVQRWNRPRARVRWAEELLVQPKPASSAPICPELEAAIIEDPDDIGGYLVYADWLQARGDPRGELIALQHALGSAIDENTRTSLAQAERELREIHAPRLLGELAAFAEGVRLTWRFGFVDEARLALNWPDGPVRPFDLESALRALLLLPAARLLRVLAFGLVGELTGAFRILEAHGPLPNLRELHLGDFDPSEAVVLSVSLGARPPPWAQLPRLTRLVVRAGTFSLGALELPHLTELELQAAALDRDHLAAIREGHLPGLRVLRLHFGHTRCTLDDVRAALEACPATLEELALIAAPATDEIVPVVAGCPFAGHLRTLDLSQGWLTRTGVDRLIGHHDAFAALAELRLEGSHHLSRAEMRRAAKALDCVVPGV
jgi:uncharacterized protein (TIGR02996 family)